ncbi:glycerophosphodiester phosphodiesterase [Shewanella sp. OPT22]|nr:glycerophosphodiester phosphodiesterase [Shewanella sp. OPT22]
MKIYAHRGASGYYPENTLLAFEKAVQMGVSAIELDIHNVEGELIVFHDRRIDKLTQQQGLLSSLTTKEILSLSIEDQTIPTLWQVLNLVAGRCEVNIELKGFNTVKPLINLYPKVLSKLNFQAKDLLFSSFKHFELQQLKQAIPEVNIAPLIDGVPLDLAQAATTLNATAINLSLNFVHQTMVDDAHQRGKLVNVFTVNHKEDMQMLADMGVDGIFTDYPDKALAFFK